MLFCKNCKNFTGMGDWNTSCKISHPTPGEIVKGNLFPCGHLCYEDTPACDAFDPVVVLEETEFVEQFCHNCGTQRCEGIGTPWFNGCRAKKFFEGYKGDVDNG